MMSPGSASSAISRSCAKNRIGECTAIGLPLPEGVSFMPRLNLPEHSRMNAMRVAMLRVHVGLYLEDEAGDVGALGIDGAPARPAGCAAAAHRMQAPRSVRPTPNLFSAEPK